MEKFLDFLIKPLLSQPEELQVIVAGSVVTLHVSQTDMGRVIGKHGIIISALRTVLRTFCLIHNLPSVTLTLADTSKTE
jgi:uncharacterized protein